MTAGRRAPLLLAGLGLAVVVYAWSRKRRARPAGPLGAPTYTLPSFATQEKVTRAEADTDGYVHVAPSTLAAQAGVGVETYTMARFLGSEYARGTPKERAAIAWTVVNVAKKRGWTLLRLATTVCSGGTCQDSGLYGKQEMPTGNRFASTARDPSKADLYIAGMVMSRAWPDFTGGGDQFVDPSDQRQLARERGDRYLTLDELLRTGRPGRSGGKWTVNSDGRQVKEVVVVDGTDATQLWLVRKIVPGGVPGTRVVPPPYA